MKKVLKITGIVVGALFVLSVIAAIAAPPEEDKASAKAEAGAPAPKPKSETKPEPKPEPKPDQKPEPKPEPKPAKDSMFTDGSPLAKQVYDALPSYLQLMVTDANEGRKGIVVFLLDADEKAPIAGFCTKLADLAPQLPEMDGFMVGSYDYASYQPMWLRAVAEEYGPHAGCEG
jgi:hypothetical protein